MKNICEMDQCDVKCDRLWICDFYKLSKRRKKGKIYSQFD